MRQHVVSAEIPFGIFGWLPSLSAANDWRLNRIGDAVAVRAVAIPCLQGHQRAHLAIDERLGALDARVEAFHMADLQDVPAPFDGLSQSFNFLHGDSEGLFAKDILAGLDRTAGGRNVEVVRCSDYHR